jgi:3-dehydroshikimate dehydratase
MIHLSAFADEISPDLDEQIAVLQSERIQYIDLRSVWGVNVLDLSDQQVVNVKQKLEEQGIKVAAIGSPIGKVPLDSPFTEHLQRFERSLVVAKMLNTSYIRLFSFYPPQTQQVDQVAFQQEAIKRLYEMTARARAANIVLLHENEKGIYGDTIAHCVDLLQNIDDKYFRAAFDPANFLQCAQIPYPNAYLALQPWLEYVHVKDVRPDETLVVAGEGAARWPELLERLRQDGYDGFFALEPHLAAAGQYQGFSGPDLFRSAAQALQKLLQQIGWEYD